jgi:predicted AAA+ superfamily ATPase
MVMIQRAILPALKKYLGQFPAVALLGPRQVGKTTLALEIVKNSKSDYLDLESDVDLNKLQQPELYFQNHLDELIVLDEVQQAPNIFKTIRSQIDKQKRQNKNSNLFLLLGSASIDLLQQSGESLAGRIAYLELTPFNLFEVGTENIKKLWVRGGFPDSYLKAENQDSFIWRQQFIKTYLERDIPKIGPRIPSETLKRFWTMLAHEQGGLLNQAKLAGNLGVDGKTVANYLDILVDLFLVRKLTPWYSNLGKRLVKSPKVYIRDSGLLHTLLGIENYDELLSNPVIGSSWEGFVIENILQILTPGTESFFYRTSNGAEVDLVLQNKKGEIVFIEVKFGLKPTVSKGLYSAMDDLKPKKVFVVYSGSEKYPISSNVSAISLKEVLEFCIDF